MISRQNWRNDMQLPIKILLIEIDNKNILNLSIFIQNDLQRFKNGIDYALNMVQSLQ